MVVITLTDCPAKLRGDLSKWMFEISTGVYVGNLSARVREELWERICGNAGNGRACMVFGTSGEQRMDFRVCNTSWEPVDLDGLKLMRRPIVCADAEDLTGIDAAADAGHGAKLGFSKAAKMRGLRNFRGKPSFGKEEEYVVIDIETTGLSLQHDAIIEVAAIRIVEGVVKSVFSELINFGGNIPDEVVLLTGLSSEMLIREGKDLQRVMEDFLKYVGKSKIIGHNIAFDMKFIHRDCGISGLPIISNTVEDTVNLARKHGVGCDNYKLETVAKSLGVEVGDRHRALSDCYLTYNVYEKLKKK